MTKRDRGPMDSWFMTFLQTTFLSYLCNVETLGVIDYSKESPKEISYDLGFYTAYSGKYNFVGNNAVAVIAHRVYFGPKNMLVPCLRLFTDLERDPRMPVYVTDSCFPRGSMDGNKWAILQQISKNTEDFYFKDTLLKKDSE